MYKRIIHSAFLIILVSSSFAQNVPTIIPIETRQNVLVLQTDKENHLGITYFGKKLSQPAEYKLIPSQSRQRDGNAGIYNSAYTPAGTWNVSEPALQLTHSDGNKSLDLVYVSHNSAKENDNVSLTSIVLKDPVYAVEVTLYYKTYFQENVVEQWSVIKSEEKKPITLQKYASANLYFIAKDYYLTHYNGTWAKEMNPEEELLTAGIRVLDSKLGTRANLYQPPCFSLSFDKPATETEGKVLLGTLAWSGNFKMEFEVDSYHNLRLIAGINPYASEYPLASKQEFKTPSFICTFSENGKGEASRNLHNWARKYRILDGEGTRMTLLNNWEATYFDFNQDKLSELFRDGKKLGVDLFLLDDGWFANKYPRNSDGAGLGDWQENVKKLPNGIGYLVKEAKKTGIKFGIWVEPEMVNPKSELYEKHPDWVIKQPQRPEHYMRNQLPLDLSNPEVQDFVYGILDKLFTENPEIAYIKWDCNATMFNPYSSYLEKSKQSQSQLYVDYVKGLYKVLEKLRAKYPKVPMMLCSGGGGRADYEAMKYFTEFWPSDNTDPLERVFMQWEYSYFFPSITQSAHVTDWGKQPLKFRTDVAMMGRLGYDIVVGDLNEKDLQFSQQAVANYNAVKNIIFQGDLFRLIDPKKNEYAALMYAGKSKSKAVLFAYLVGNRNGDGSETPIRLEGLDASKNYRVKELNLYPETKSAIKDDQIYSGEYLMTAGFNPVVNARRTSVVIEIEAI
ncbi:alpha-galactosidase [Dyadobacter sp. CY345]|uniref:alpha-galactosidase n=1 Tax=Dyadobacter sp. CY345 TaxID=2909335 RepID=UPI001F32CC8B|nr:alpha-galactosidase [Dyadobacter sp. CY345]MCF2446918.1 alpha-galactosidase [Dyadobacter sp. CY345]